MKINLSTSSIGILLYVFAVIVGLFLIVIATWADVEAAFYGFDRRASTPLRGFTCPVIMTRNETSVISLRVSNTTDRSLRPSVKTEISTAALPESFLESIEVEQGGSRRLEWSIGPQNIDLGRFIFAKALVFASYPIPDRETTCGVFIVDLPGRGIAILIGLIAFSMIGMGYSLYWMNKSGFFTGNRMNALSPLIFLMLVVVIGLTVSMMGLWLQSIALLAMALLTSLVVINALVLKHN